MKQLLYSLIAVFIFSSCSSTKNYLSRTDEDATLFDVVKVLNKHPGDTAAINALPVLYAHARQRHLKIIEGYNNSKDLNRWSQIINEYSVLQKMYDAIAGTNAAKQLVTPINFQSTIYDLKQQAAEEYYNEATVYFAEPGRENAKKAYVDFKKADKWVPGYKDTKAKMDEAYQHAIVNIVINEIKDNSYYLNSSLGNYNIDYSNQRFLQNLVRELGGQNSDRYPARFYTYMDAQRDNIQPDMIVDLTLRNLDIPRPSTYTNSYRRSQEIEVSRDTSGRVIYQTIYAVVNAEQQSYSARVEMELNITDAGSRKNIMYNAFRDGFSWQEQHGSYSGDSRALTSEDWSIINNNNYQEMTKDDILNRIYDRIYPQVKNKIIQVADW
jgi:hypothetical protein